MSYPLFRPFAPLFLILSGILFSSSAALMLSHASFSLFSFSEFCDRHREAVFAVRVVLDKRRVSYKRMNADVRFRTDQSPCPLVVLHRLLVLKVV